MKTRLQTTSIGLALAATMLLGTSGCNDDWGQQDPAAGNQVYPTLQTVATIAFENEDGDHELPAGFTSKALAADAIAEVLDDEIALSPVLSLNNAVASFDNPLKASKCQTGVSVSFWMRQPIERDEDGNALTTQDLSTPIIAFVNPKPAEAAPDTPAAPDDETGAADESKASRDDDPTDEPSTDEPEATETPYEIYGTLAFNANGGISYDADNGLFSDNDPSQFLTGYITPDEWHFVALNIYDEGYAIYVDGMRKVDKYIPNFDCHKMVEFANNAKLVCINGTPDSENVPELLLDDVTFARNNFTAKEVAMPKKGNIGGGGSDGEDGENIYVFGPDDNVAGFWSQWTPSVNLQGDGSIHYEFINYTAGNNNWENWILVLTSAGLSPNDNGYDGASELIVLRADAYGWAAYYEAATKESNYNWDTFTSEMNGAEVTVDIYRKGDVVEVKSKTIGASGQEYYWNVSFSGYTGETLGSFFTIENAHLEFRADETFVGRTYESGTYTLGNKDFSNAFWSCWTPQERFTAPFTNFGFEFVNHSIGAGNYQFWNLVVTNGYQSGAGDADYSEYLYIRDDAWGWASCWEGATITHEFDWDTFIADMQGATSRVMFNCDGNNLLMVARQWREDGTEMPIYKFENDGFGLPLSLIFTCEGSWLDFVRIGYYPWCDLTTK